MSPQGRLTQYTLMATWKV